MNIIKYKIQKVTLKLNNKNFINLIIISKQK